MSGSENCDEMRPSLPAQISPNRSLPLLAEADFLHKVATSGARVRERQALKTSSQKAFDHQVFSKSLQIIYRAST